MLPVVYEPVLSSLTLANEEEKSVEGPKYELSVVLAPPIVLTWSPVIFCISPVELVWLRLLSVGTPKAAIRAFNPLSVPFVLSKKGRLWYSLL